MDYLNPDYVPIFAERVEALNRIRSDPACIPALKAHYKLHPATFISDWGMTFEPRNANKGLPVIIPFVLFPRQVEYVEWFMERWYAMESGLCEKSRGMGLSWIMVGIFCALGLFTDNFAAGIGSRKEILVDRIGDPDSLLWKARFFISHLPVEFNGGWDEKKDSSHMIIKFPLTGSSITGEAGDGIGRGGRKSVYGVDESSHIQHPEMMDASLSDNTDCRIDFSTVNGMNRFEEIRNSGRVSVFTFHLRDDPRKDEAWIIKKKASTDPVTYAGEYDIDYKVSIKGSLIKPDWVQAAIDAHIKLDIEPTGERRGALDVADEGNDLNAFCATHGILLNYIEDWSGKGSDIYETTERSFNICERLELSGFDFDSDGLGVGVRGDARKINLERKTDLRIEPFHGSGKVIDPDEIISGKTLNKDFFQNLKAQSWWSFRKRFETTYQAVVKGMDFDPDEIISISSEIDSDTLRKLCNELSQPTYAFNQVGKMQVNKAPSGAKSPNLADSVMIRFAPTDYIDYSLLID